MHQKIVFGLFTITLAASTMAQAQATRTWVSGTGSDANTCSRTAPCLTFASAFTKTATGGEINALDPGSFGSLTITKAITINGGGGQVVAAEPSGSTGIAIQAGATDAVTLRNIDVVGVGLSGDGIQITQAGVVHIEKVHISGFQGNGINVSSSSVAHVFVDDSSSNSNSSNGLLLTNQGSVSVVAVSRSHFEANGAAGISNTGGKVAAVDTTAAGNASGFLADATAAAASITITRCDATGNSGSGFGATGGGVLRAASSSSQLNGAAVTATNGGFTVSFGNNNLVGAGVFTNTIALK